ncbi:cbb3-type cytochrome c oxidase subunit I [Aliifodinibius sp. S!AR15-10]|uniref:cbb3-type cytochrome c oxidase subunit I n=1 Tax=Aliifodinibius sp. S!AR15-10 TaxID=2950437 RepID=UPI0028633662|nr:cbb3-type cytochrome c oxidase subunit I [Aliifodinibius sp. S!AR15-10]MDR8390729.1 cbb3-type cytochrome c oxidase subunit I [Aliifodinibius sp. S!AR15-10]
MPHWLKSLLQGHAGSASKSWIFISISALILAGFLSLFIMMGRIPLINKWMFDTQWMRRILVVHVNLALLVSFYSFIASCTILLPEQPPWSRRYPVAIMVSLLSIALMISSIFFTGSEAVLANYIPVVDHPVFVASLLFFGFSICLTIFSKRLLPFRITDNNAGLLPPGAAAPIRSAGVLILISVFIFLISWLITPLDLSTNLYYEFIFWGGGHVLQFANMIAAVGIWIVLYQEISGKELFNTGKISALCYIYTIPVLATPLLLLEGTDSTLYLKGFTLYMSWGIFPVVSVFIVVLLVKTFSLLNNQKSTINFLKNPYSTGLVASIFLTIIGFILGAMISGSNTMVPAHYHATLGAVTIVFMSATYWLMEQYGYSFSSRRNKGLLFKQLLTYTTGQLIFVAGLAVAGSYGLARKVFGQEQIIHAPEIYIGLGLLLFGGLLAIAGGVMFLWNLIASFKSK